MLEFRSSSRRRKLIPAVLLVLKIHYSEGVENKMFIFQTVDEARMQQMQKVTYTMNIYEKSVRNNDSKPAKQDKIYSFKGFRQLIAKF